MEHRLILVEGLPGSGKSSTAQFICDQLQRNGHKARWYYEEEEPHPLAVGGLRDADAFQDYSRAVRRRWRGFARRTAKATEIPIIEARFLQDAIFPLLSADVSPALIVAHLKAVVKICMPLNPALVYLHQPDYGKTMRRICDQRGERIEKLYVSRNESSVYGKRLGLTGFEGLVQFWLAVRAIMEKLLNAVDTTKLAIDNTERLWAQYYQQVGDWLDLPGVEFGQPSGDLEPYTGTYTYKRDGAPRRVGGESVLALGNWARRVGGRPRELPQHYQKDIEFYIRLDGGELVMHEYGWLWPTNRLIPKEKDTFYIGSWPFVMEFERDAEGQVTSATRVNPTGKWLVTGQEYPRVSDSLE